MPNKLTDADYEIEAISKGLLILDVLIEERFVLEKRIVEKTRLSRDTVMRSLRTLRLRGYADRNARREWFVGPGFVTLAMKIARRQGL